MDTIKIVALAFLLPIFVACGESSTTVEPEANSKDNLTNISCYPIVGTNQTDNYNNTSVISVPSVGEAFYGQAQHIQIGLLLPVDLHHTYVLGEHWAI